MKAVVYSTTDRRTSEVRDIKKPVPNDDQVLVKVRAASLNPSTGISCEARHTLLASE